MVRVKDSIRLRLEKMVDRYEEIGRSLADPAVIGRQREFRDLSVEYARLTPVAEKFGTFRALESELAAAREMQNDGGALAEAYGLDIFNPPPEAVGSGRIPPLAHKKAWEHFSLDEWQQIRRTFGVTQVLAYADWALHLPVVSQSRRLILYDIPDR